MITLHKLVPPENEDIFRKHAELNGIWELPELQTEARESYEKWHLKKYPGESLGEIFTIAEFDSVIGLIGWFEYGEFLDTLRLRYYGIVPSRRGRGYGEAALCLLLRRLSTCAPTYAVYLSESVTLSRQKADQVVGHFERVGFEDFNDPNYGENARCGPVRSLRIRIPGR